MGSSAMTDYKTRATVGRIVRAMLLIRDVQPDDAEAVVALLNPIIESGLYTTFVEPFTPSFERAFIESFPARGHFIGAFEDASDSAFDDAHDNGQLRGFQVVTPAPGYTPALDHVAEIGTYVSLDYQQRGVAGQLFSATLERAKLHGFEKLLAWVRADNAAGLRSYRKCGFAEVGTAKRHAKVGGRYVDVVLLEYLLVR